MILGKVLSRSGSKCFFTLCTWFNKGFIKVGRVSMCEGMDHKMITFWSLAGVSFVCSRLSVNSC